MRRAHRGAAAAGLAALTALATLLLSCPSTSADPDVSTTTEFDSSKRGTKMYGDSCTSIDECGFQHSICDGENCRCDPTMPISNDFDKCAKAAGINESCTFNQQCEAAVIKTTCRNERCVCMYEMVPEVTVGGAIICKSQKQVEESTQTLDPAMIGVLVGMALMFVIICVVLRLFSRARWRENRTIFNTPNPRLMNVSLLRDSKLLHAQDRRGSRVSMRPPSRQASQQELRPHSPSPARHHQSHQLHRKPSGSRRGSRASSGHSASSLRSATLRSPTATGPTSVTVEIRVPDA
ncbi:uncharacterized protein LOC106719847 isoform X1 [Papilio machaon]|uniref:uncharacterized protein LOC106719847 isoform X1 n=1 Tax=Papilio machaon TaxID=76193 RepID=UPI001E664D02|nr:uncharacterized protein LOC106719847 isoform X1 [Papilio machaon]